MELEKQEKVTFADVPAPPPAFERVMEVPPYPDTLMDAAEVEAIRAKARDRWRRIGR